MAPGDLIVSSKAMRSPAPLYASTQTVDEKVVLSSYMRYMVPGEFMLLVGLQRVNSGAGRDHDLVYLIGVDGMMYLSWSHFMVKQ